MCRCLEWDETGRVFIHRGDIHFMSLAHRYFEVDMTHIQYQAETLPVPLVLAFYLVLGKFHSYV